MLMDARPFFVNMVNEQNNLQLQHNVITGLMNLNG